LFWNEEELEKARRQLEEAQKRGEKVYIDFPPNVEKEMEKERKRTMPKCTYFEDTFKRGGKALDKMVEWLIEAMSKIPKEEMEKFLKELEKEVKP